MSRWGGDHGQVAGIEVLPFGMLIFVVGSLLVANAWAVVDARLAVASAAREAARAYVEAPDPNAAHEAATIAARHTVEGHGRNPDRLRLGIEHDGGRPWGRCVRIRAVGHYPVPALTLPWIGGYGRAFLATATHSEIIDPYRSGLAGEAQC
jgi:hypothetical protein